MPGGSRRPLREGGEAGFYAAKIRGGGKAVFVEAATPKKKKKDSLVSGGPQRENSHSLGEKEKAPKRTRISSWTEEAVSRKTLQSFAGKVVRLLPGEEGNESFCAAPSRESSLSPKGEEKRLLLPSGPLFIGEKKKVSSYNLKF